MFPVPITVAPTGGRIAVVLSVVGVTFVLGAEAIGRVFIFPIVPRVTAVPITIAAHRSMHDAGQFTTSGQPQRKADKRFF
jgi:hypothetical protein